MPTAQTVTSARIAALSAAIMSEFADSDDVPGDLVTCGELAEILALAAAGKAQVEGLIDGARKLELTPGDLVVVRTPDVDDSAAYAATRASLETMADTFRIRIIAFPATVALEVVPVDELDALVETIGTRVYPIAGDPPRRARALAAVCGDSGLLLSRPVRQ